MFTRYAKCEGERYLAFIVDTCNFGSSGRSWRYQKTQILKKLTVHYKICNNSLDYPFLAAERTSSRMPFVSNPFDYDSSVSPSENLGGHPFLNGYTKVSLPFLNRKSHFLAPSAIVL